MKGQLIFYSFLPSVTAAVLTAQPTWAQQLVSPSISTPVKSRNFVVENVTNQVVAASDISFSTIITPAALQTAKMQQRSSKFVGENVTKTIGVPIEEISLQDGEVVFRFTPTPHQTQQFATNLQPEKQELGTNGNSVISADAQTVSLTPQSQTQNLQQSDLEAKTLQQKDSVNSAPSKVRQKLRDVIITRALTPKNLPTEQTNADDPQQLTTSVSSPVKLKQRNDIQLSAFLQNAAKKSGAAKLLEVQDCPQDMTACSHQNLSQELVSQATSPTSTPVPTNNQQLTTPQVPVVSPTSKPSITPAPDYLNPNKSNPLQFPTKPEEVKLKGTQPITLQQAVELAQRNNTQLQVSLLELERAKAAVREAQAALYPTVDLSSDITRQQSASNQLNDELQRKEVEEARRLNPNIRTPESTDDVNTGFNGQAQLRYNVYTSGRRSANIRAAQEQLRFQQLDVLRQSEDIRLTVARNYYDLQEADENVRITQSAVTNAEKTLEDAQNLEEAGVGTQFDVLRAQVTLANAQQDLTEALSNQRIARSQLATTLNVPGSLGVSAADAVRLAGLWNLSLEQTIVLAYQNRAELQQQLAQRDLSAQQRRLALADLGPQVSLIANYNLLDQFDDGVGITDGYSLGVQATLNLFDGGAARARADQQEANIKIAETQFSDRRNQIRFEVEQAYSQLKSSQDQVQTANVALEQARESLRLARLRFQAGVGTQTDVISAENDLTRAEGNVVSAILGYNRALATLERSVTTRGLQQASQ